jgi:hypothetical protein
MQYIFYRCVRLRVHVCNYAEHLTDAVSIGVVSESHAAWFRICSPCFACPSSIASWSKRARRHEIFDVKLTFVRMQSRRFPFDAQVYSFKQGDRRSPSKRVASGGCVMQSSSLTLVVDCECGRSQHLLFSVFLRQALPGGATAAPSRWVRLESMLLDCAAESIMRRIREIPSVLHCSR